MRFMAQNTVYLGECSMGAWEECIIWFGVKCLIEGNYIQFTEDARVQLHSYWFSVARSVQSDKALKSPTIIVHSSIFLCISIDFCLMYYSTVTRCIHIKDYYVFLEEWPLLGEWLCTVPLYPFCEFCSVWN